MGRMRGHAEGIQRQRRQQNVDHDHRNEDQLADLHRAQCHHHRENQVAEEGKAQLLGITSRRQFRAEHAHFHHPGRRYGIPKEGIRAKHRAAPDVLMQKVENTGD